MRAPNVGAQRGAETKNETAYEYSLRSWMIGWRVCCAVESGAALAMT